MSRQTVASGLPDIAQVADDVARAIREGLGGDIERFLANSRPPFRRPADAAATMLAELHGILLTLHGDQAERDEMERVRYAIHSLLRLVVKVGAALKSELGISPSSARASDRPDIEGEPWEF